MKNKDYSVSSSCINGTIHFFSSLTQDALPNQDYEMHTHYQHVLSETLSYKLISEAFHFAEYEEPDLHKRYTYKNYPTKAQFIFQNNHTMNVVPMFEITSEEFVFSYDTDKENFKNPTK